MKKITLILALALSSCAVTPYIDNKISPLCVTEITPAPCRLCKYRLDNYLDGYKEVSVYVIDSCGKYKVGDTLLIVKK